MLLTNDSFINNVPNNLDLKQQQLIEAFRYSGNMTMLSFDRLKVSLFNVLANNFTPPFLDIWSVIDSAEKFFRILNSLYDGWVKSESISHYNILKDINPFRNTFHHLDERITKEDANLISNIPLFWTIKFLKYEGWETIKSIVLLSWTPRKDMYTHTLLPQSWLMYNIWVHDIILESYNKQWKRIEVKIDNIIRAIEYFFINLDEQLNNQIPKDSPRSWSDLCMCMDIKQKST